MVLVIILLVMIIGLFASAMSGILQAALYNYATTGSSEQYFQQNMLAGAFRQKR